MTINAQIGFTQDTNIGAPGQALFGVTGTAVVIRNCTNTPDIQKWTFGIIDAPPGSSAPTGDFQSGSTQTASFSPDKVGGYLAKLTVEDGAGNTATDYRVFQVKLASGRYIPPFNAKGAALNFLGQGRGWSPVMEEWLGILDVLESKGTDISLVTGLAKSQAAVGAPDTIGAREIDLSAYPASIGSKNRVATFLGALQATAGTATLSLYDTINGVVLTNGTLTTTNAALTQVSGAALQVGTTNGKLRTDLAGGGMYIARLALTGGGGGDFAICTNARVRIQYV